MQLSNTKYVLCIIACVYRFLDSKIHYILISKFNCYDKQIRLNWVIIQPTKHFYCNEAMMVLNVFITVLNKTHTKCNLI